MAADKPLIEAGTTGSWGRSSASGKEKRRAECFPNPSGLPGDPEHAVTAGIVWCGPRILNCCSGTRRFHVVRRSGCGGEPSSFASACAAVRTASVTSGAQGHRCRLRCSADAGQAVALVPQNGKVPTPLASSELTEARRAQPPSWLKQTGGLGPRRLDRAAVRPRSRSRAQVPRI